MKTETLISICDINNPTGKPLFNADSYPVVPNVGEEIYVGSTNYLKTCKVVRREISYTTEIDGDHTVFVLIWVKVL